MLVSGSVAGGNHHQKGCNQQRPQILVVAPKVATLSWTAIWGGRFGFWIKFGTIKERPKKVKDFFLGGKG